MKYIDRTCTVNQLLMDHPVVISTLNEFGVDACCGGASTLEETARNDGIDLDSLLGALERAIATEGSPADVGSAQ